ncbi:DoxX-like family protein [Actinopolymorpha cephalotaxi]|uniref:DoxX-like family protein n=1 Tax=Actinopolymorpha cephalotaxi TaxID=504797 RepID=A0A1I2XDH4_9ACTN|nr:DoxX family protein [Actinopolymorpha cephalotaxi]NYH86199.1 magnesium-transporting ATPase (P-type) [Actinopolymorpha cephalotaxi]SFH11515.1 DoxX-like family protein [Actinopolymorpha cephalotaxi]
MPALVRHTRPHEFAPAREGWDRNRIRTVLYWATTLVILVELASGSVWNLVPIDWITAQLDHLGYPSYFAGILGVWQVAAAAAIIAPRFALTKEWAYAGCCFLWSGAVWSHLIAGDSPSLWGVPLVFGVCAVASWVLRPTDRRLPVTLLHRHRGSVGDERAQGSRSRAFGAGHRAWAVAAGLLVAAYAFSLLTLPVIEPVMHERAVELGWLDP